MNEAAVIAIAVAVGLIVAAVLLRHPLLRALGYRLVPHADEALRDATPSAPQREIPRKEGERERSGITTDLAELEVSDVMVHRTAMRSLNADDPAQAIIREVLQGPHTRLPLWRGTIDNIVGVLDAKDLLRALMEVDNDPARIDIAKVAAKPWFVPDTTTLQDQLNAFLRRKARLAIVVDEYGEVEGIVTLEDIIEEVVGDLSDDHDIDLQGVRKEPGGSIVVDGGVSIRDLNRAMGWSLPDEEATTIAGLVIHETQSIPDERQAFTFHGKRFVVLKRERNRIARLRIKAVATVGIATP